MRYRLILAALLLPLPTLALDVSAYPAGMCAVGQNTPGGKLAWDYLTQANQGSNRVVAVFADCAEAAKADVLLHYGTVLEQQVEAIPLSREHYLQAASQMVALNQGLVDQGIAQALGAAGNAATSNSLQVRGANASSNGVLLNGKDVLVIGMEQEHMIGSKPMKVASTAGITLVNGTPVSVNLYAPLKEAGAQARARDAIVAYVPQLIAANE